MKEVSKQKTEKYITIPIFEKAMQAIARRFDGLDERFKRVDRALETVVKEIRHNHEEHEYFRSTLRTHDAEIVIHDRKIDGLLDRIEVLETKR